MRGSNEWSCVRQFDDIGRNIYYSNSTGEPCGIPKEAITENNLPVFYPQLKQQMNYQSSWLAGKYTDFALWRSC
ncbi:hypothetical protein A8V49_21625, partial [Yersinia pestis]